MREKKYASAAVLFGGMVILSAIFTVQGYVLDEMILHYQLSQAAKGVPAMLCSLGGICALLCAFALNGRVRKQTLLCVGNGICAAFLLLIFFLPPFAAFCVCWFCIGFGLGFMDTLLSSCMAELFSGKTATRMMCFLHTTYGASAMLLPVLFTLWGSAAFNVLYLAVAAGGMLVLAAMIAVFYGGKGHAATRTEKKQGRDEQGVRKLLCGGIPFYAAALFCHGFFLGGLNNWITRYVGVTLGSGLGSLSLTFLYAGVLLSRMLFPFTGIRAGKYICFASPLAAILLGVALPLKSGLIMCIAASGSALIFGATIPCVLDVACELSRENTLPVTTVMILSLYLGQAAVSPVLGVLDQSVGLLWGMVLCAVMMVLTGGMCIMAGKKNEGVTKK